MPEMFKCIQWSCPVLMCPVCRTHGVMEHHPVKVPDTDRPNFPIGA